MTDWLLSAVPTYGPWLVAMVTFLSCLALPVPASILMLAAGGFAAAGDLGLWQVAGGALAGAVVGDQTGYWAARAGGPTLLARIAKGDARAPVVEKARTLLAAKGVVAVFLTRWLLSPLGPYANLVTGATGFGWLPFTLAAAAGEAVWVGVYTGAGFAFGGNLQAATQFAGSIIGFLAAGTVAFGLGFWLLSLARSGH
ncbi:VTT domain-containing protein [Rhodobacter sp. Har01]|uniref:DedA family protein n=1 Tax=Rhodobacter sp. Har01 TaxID=2883999 RepID=UPI001D07B90E|nr:VTT domain-containing protein [Rhodobacter sp. Har01]MCB6177351.1 VTT domain-containing protein [Rhodobacter sp. Har01]